MDITNWMIKSWRESWIIWCHIEKGRKPVFLYYVLSLPFGHHLHTPFFFIWLYTLCTQRVMQTCCNRASSTRDSNSKEHLESFLNNMMYVNAPYDIICRISLVTLKKTSHIYIYISCVSKNKNFLSSYAPSPQYF